MFKWSGTAIAATTILAVAGGVVSFNAHSQIGPVLIGLAGLWVLVTIFLDPKIEHYKGISLVAVLGALVLAIAWCESQISAGELKEKEGELIASNLPTPANPQGCVPPGVLGIYLADNAATADHFPHKVVMMHGVDLLVLDRDDKGRLQVNARIFDDRGDLVARVENNHFLVTNAASHMDRPDESDLVVYDHLDRKVLWISYLNHNAIRVTGTFRYPGSRTVSVTENQMNVEGGFEWHGSCFHSNTADLVF